MFRCAGLASSQMANTGQSIAVQLQGLITQYHHVMGRGVTAVTPVVGHIGEWLRLRRYPLREQCRANGWPAGGPGGYHVEYVTAQRCVAAYLQTPNNGSEELLNEAMTQLHWLLTHLKGSV